jgi:hypothetical protein
VCDPINPVVNPIPVIYSRHLTRDNIKYISLQRSGIIGIIIIIIVIVEGKAIPVTGREGPQGYETSRLPHFLDNRHTDGGEFVSLMGRPPFTPRKIPGTHFC